MNEIENYLKELALIKKKAYDNWLKGNKTMATYYKKKYYDMLDNHGLKGIEGE